MKKNSLGNNKEEMIMRKSYFAIIALGALVIASCQKENSADLPKVDSPVFTATLDTGSDTKTELVERDGKKKSEWVSGDATCIPDNYLTS